MCFTLYIYVVQVYRRVRKNRGESQSHSLILSFIVVTDFQLHTMDLTYENKLALMSTIRQQLKKLTKDAFSSVYLSRNDTYGGSIKSTSYNYTIELVGGTIGFIVLLIGCCVWIWRFRRVRRSNVNQG